MKKTAYIIVLIAISFGCNNGKAKLSNNEIIEGYVNGLNQSDFKQIEAYISDSLTTSEGGFILTNSKSKYYTHFKWDSVFQPRYKIIQSNTISDDTTEITISKFCKRIEYLHDSATVYGALFVVKKNKICLIDNHKLIVFDTLKWEHRRDTLVSWININYPELTGFVYDQTPIGAQNYLKAINLFLSAQ